MLSNSSLTDRTVKYFARMSRKLAHSVNMCFTVSRNSQGSQVGGSSPHSMCE